MKNLTATQIQRIKIISNSVLVATMEGNSDVQLRQSKDGYWMTSPKTGNHFITSQDGKISERVELHWNGFKLNQNNN